MIWTIFATLAAMMVSIIPAIAGGIAMARLVSGYGPDARRRMELFGVVGFFIAYGLSLWGLIEWWVL